MGKQSKSRHREAAKRHDRQAREHDNAARVWLRRGDSVRAGFEQRAAKLERELAELERDHAAYEARKHAVVSTRGKDMRVAGVEIRDGAAAQLACLLHKNGEHSLAFHLGHAIGHLHDHLALTRVTDGSLVASWSVARLSSLTCACLLADDLGGIDSGA